MKINNKIFLVLLISFLFLIIALSIYMNFRQKQNNVLFDTYKIQQEQVIHTSIFTQSNNIKTLVFDYTYWDEVVDYVDGKKDKEWENTILSTLLPTYKMNGLWVFNLKQTEIYQINDIGDSTKIKINLSTENWDYLNKNHFINFILKTKEGYIELHGATIHLSSDIKREKDFYGYFFVGKYYDSNYFNLLKELTSCDISIIKPDSLIEPIYKTNINIVVPLKDADNHIIAKLVFSKNYKMLQGLRNMSVFYMIFIISSVIITLLAFYICFHLWVNKPLSAIMITLSNNNTEPIIPLLKKKNEFGKISELILNFIKQKEELQQEINKRQLVETAYTTQEKLYKSLFNSSLIGISFSKGQQIINANEVFIKLFEFDSLNEIKNKKIIDLVTADSKKLLNNRYFSKSSNHSVEDSYELEIICKSGKTKQVMVYSQDIHIDNEIYQQTIINDITEKKKYEVELLLEKAYFQQLFDESPEAIIITDNQAIILKVNKKFTSLFGYSSQEAIGKTTMELLQPYSKNDEIITLVNKVLNGESVSYESVRKNKYGENIDVHILGTPILVNNSQLGIYAIYRDITDKKKYNDELKLRSIIFKSLANGLSNLWKLEAGEKSINLFLETIGKAANGDRAYIFKNNTIGNEITMSLIYEWVDENINPEINNPFKQNIAYQPTYTTWYRLLSQGKTISSKANEWIEIKDKILITNDIKAFIFVPVFVKNALWGFIGLDNCKKEKSWSDTEISIMSIAANNIGNFIEQKLNDEELKTAKNKAEESERLKSNFIANMSHELRTPLNGMLGFAELLNDELDNMEHKEMVSVIQKSGNRLMDTLNSILDLSLIEANRIVVGKVNVDINSIFAEKNEYYQMMAHQRELTFNINSKHNYQINTDIKFLNRILNNLIDNAFKYTKKGGVTIDLSDEQINGTDYLIIKIIDTGIGIENKYFTEIFQYFRQISEGLSREYEGNGIGLTICKKYIDLLKGTIEVESKIGEGSTFTIKLPGLLPEETYINSKSNTENFQVKPKILLVEDEISNREYTFYVLSKVFDMDVAENGFDAISLTNSNVYAAILMDINLGKGINGIEATKEIRQNPLYENTPIAAVTANAMQGQREEYLSNGLTHYISKPYNKNEIIKFVNKMIFNDDTI